MTTVGPATTSDRGHNFVPLPAERRGVPEREEHNPQRAALADSDASAAMDPDSSIRLRRIEFLVALLCDRLVEHGHDIDLFCTSGSHSSARTAAPSDGTSRQAQHVGAPGRMTR
jgi:hypothetical protein